MVPTNPTYEVCDKCVNSLPIESRAMFRTCVNWLKAWRRGVVIRCKQPTFSLSSQSLSLESTATLSPQLLAVLRLGGALLLRPSALGSCREGGQGVKQLAGRSSISSMSISICGEKGDRHVSQVVPHGQVVRPKSSVVRWATIERDCWKQEEEIEACVDEGNFYLTVGEAGWAGWVRTIRTVLQRTFTHVHTLYSWCSIAGSLNGYWW